MDRTDARKLACETAEKLLNWVQEKVSKGMTPDEIAALPEVVSSAIDLLEYSKV